MPQAVLAIGICTRSSIIMQIDHEDRHLKSEHFHKLIKENKSNSKHFHQKTALKLRQLKSKISFFSTHEKLLKCWTSIFPWLGRNLWMNSMSTEFVTRQLRGLKTNKAAGLDRISVKLLKDLADIISPVLLQYLINLSIDQNNFLNSWKSAKVVALFKIGGSSDCQLQAHFYPSHCK